MDTGAPGRMNALLAKMPPDVLKSQTLRPIRSLVTTLGQTLDDIALTHLGLLPRAARTRFACRV